MAVMKTVTSRIIVVVTKIPVGHSIYIYISLPGMYIKPKATCMYAHTHTQKHKHLQREAISFKRLSKRNWNHLPVSCTSIRQPQIPDKFRPHC